MAYEKVLAKKVNPVKAIAVSFLVVIAIGTVLLMMPFSSREGKTTGLIDSLFTATSAITVTGLVVKDTHAHYSLAGQLVILLLIQIGGLGYMTFMSFLFIFARNMKLAGGVYIRESMNLPTLGEVYKFARNVVLFVLLFEALGAVALFSLLDGETGVKTAVKYAAFHSVSAFNNAGFDLFGGFNSLSQFAGNVPINLTIISLTIIGGIGFVVINELMRKVRKPKRRLSLHTKIVLATSAVLLVLGALAFFALERGNEKTLGGLSFSEKLVAAAFHSATARTSGFATTVIGSLGTATLIILGLLMFIGSSPAGTGGGIKTTTAAVAVKALVSFAKGRRETEIMDRRVSSNVVVKSFAIIASAASLIIAASFVMSAIEPYPYEKLMFEAISAFSTTGLTTGITPGLTEASKLILMSVMFIGRIGPLAVLQLLLSRRGTTGVRLPEDDVMVG